MPIKYKYYRGGLVTGITIFTIGFVFLLDNLGLVDISLVWPIIPIGIGIGMIIRFFSSSKGKDARKSEGK